MVEREGPRRGRVALKALLGWRHNARDTVERAGAGAAAAESYCSALG